MHEAQMHPTNSFITLTYNDESIDPYGSLNLRDWQQFGRNLRKKIGKFRYFQCGEYGADDEPDKPGTRRPHHHFVCFGHDFMSDRTFYTMSNEFPLYNSPTVDKAWGKGHCQIGDLTFESAAYVARYQMKKINGDQAEDHYLSHTDLETGEICSRKPEYVTMSLKPGIGASWFKKYQGEVFPRDEVVSQSRLVRPPTFYDKLLEDKDPDLMQLIKSKRRVKARQHDDNNTPDRLAVREKLKEIQIRRLKRTI